LQGYVRLREVQRQSEKGSVSGKTDGSRFCLGHVAAGSFPAVDAEDCQQKNVWVPVLLRPRYFPLGRRQRTFLTYRQSGAYRPSDTLAVRRRHALWFG